MPYNRNRYPYEWSTERPRSVLRKRPSFRARRREWTPRDRSCFSFFISRFEFTKFPRLTSLDIPGGSRVRLLHKGSLGREERDAVRDTVQHAKDRVDKAIFELQTGMVSESTRALIKQCFGTYIENVHPSNLHMIDEGLKKIADGLYSPKLQIKLINDDMALNQWGHRSNVPRAPYRSPDAYGHYGIYSDAYPEISVKLCKPTRDEIGMASTALIGAVARQAAGLNAATRLYLVEAPPPAATQREPENRAPLKEQLGDLKKAAPQMSLEEFGSFAKNLKAEALGAMKSGELSRKAYNNALAELDRQFKAKCDSVARQFDLRDDRSRARSGGRE